MKRSKNTAASILPEKWPIGLSLLLIIGVYFLGGMTESLEPPLSVITDLAMIVVLFIALLGSTARLYQLLQRRKSSQSRSV